MKGINVKRIAVTIAVISGIFLMNTVVFATTYSHGGTVIVTANKNGYSSSTDTVTKGYSDKYANLSNISGASNNLGTQYSVYVSNTGTASAAAEKYITAVGTIQDGTSQVNLYYTDGEYEREIPYALHAKLTGTPRVDESKLTATLRP